MFCENRPASSEASTPDGSGQNIFIIP